MKRRIEIVFENGMIIINDMTAQTRLSWIVCKRGEEKEVAKLYEAMLFDTGRYDIFNFV